MSELLNLYFHHLGRIKKSSWGKNSIFMLLGIIIAVGTLTVSMILFESYEQTLKSVFKKSQADVEIYKVDSWNKNQNLEKKVCKYLDDSSNQIASYDVKNIGEAIVEFGEECEPFQLISYNNNNRKYNSNQYNFYTDNFYLNDNEIILGKYLAEAVNVAVGDTIQIVLPSTIKYSIFGFTKKAKRFKVKSIYHSGLYFADKTRGFVSKKTFSSFLTKKNFDKIDIILNDRNYADSYNLSQKINTKLMTISSSLYAVDSLSNNKILFATLSLQKLLIFIILNIIVLVSSFNIISSVSSIITEKINEIGILLTLGLKKIEIKVLYFLYAFIISNVGIFIGIIIGTVAAYVLANQHLITLKGDIYFIEQIIVKPHLSLYLILYFVTMIIISLTILISLKPIDKMSIIDIIKK